MTSRTNEIPRAQDSRDCHGDQPHWVLIAGGALLSSLSIRLGYKLKQALDSRLQNQGKNSTQIGRQGNCQLRSNEYSFTHAEDIHFSYDSANEGFMGRKQTHSGHMTIDCKGALPLVTVPATEYGQQNGVMWASSPDRHELPPKPFHYSNSSFSPSVSESGSDVFSKPEVIRKLRHQLKRRDEMILEMQDQILELQSTLSSQVSHSTQLQSQLDAMNQDLFDSENEIQRLRKTIAEHCLRQVNPNETVSPALVSPAVRINGHANGDHHETTSNALEKGRSTSDRIEMLQREVGELKEVIEAKDYLLQSYEEQKTEMSGKIKELQLRLNSQLPNIL